MCKKSEKCGPQQRKVALFDDDMAIRIVQNASFLANCLQMSWISRNFAPQIQN